jgi:HD domain
MPMDLHRPFDAPGAIDTRSPQKVAEAIRAMLAPRIEGLDAAFLFEAFDNVARLYAGEREGFLACDTPYHDLRHALETALAMARLVDGWESAMSRARGSLGPDVALLALILALMHDIGFLRRDSEGHVHGASLTLQHEARGAEFAERYLERSPLRPLAPLARLIDATRLDSRMEAFDGSEIHRVVARMLATADLVCQVADRCWLEKCRDFLYAELVEAGLARGAHGRNAQAPYASPEDLLSRTPLFCERHVVSRLDGDLAGVHRLMRTHFGGHDPYGDAIARNRAYLDAILAHRAFDRLRRQPEAVLRGID